MVAWPEGKGNVMCRAGGRRCPGSGGNGAGGGSIGGWIAGLAAQDAADGVRASERPGEDEAAAILASIGKPQVSQGTATSPDAAGRPSGRERYRDPGMRKLLGLDTPEGAARFDRVTRAREAGYDGPLDQDGRRPDMSRPENQEAAAILDNMARRTAARMAEESR